jgi:hypothetical protein
MTDLPGYDAWKCREPDLAAENATEHVDIDEPSDSSIERLLEDARLGDTVASVTLVEACERALDAESSEEEARSARQHIRDYLSSPTLTTTRPTQKDGTP